MFNPAFLDKSLHWAVPALLILHMKVSSLVMESVTVKIKNNIFSSVALLELYGVSKNNPDDVISCYLLSIKLQMYK